MSEDTRRDEVLAYLRLLLFVRSCGGRLLDDSTCDHLLARCIRRIASQWNVREAELAVPHEDNVPIH